MGKMPDVSRNSLLLPFVRLPKNAVFATKKSIIGPE
jgi:hypothetical protein